MSEILRYQSERGPLPRTREGLAAWAAALSARMPSAQIAIPAESIAGLRAAGFLVDDRGRLRFPCDGDALDRVFALLDLESPGGARAILAALEEDRPPRQSLPIKVQPARACALGWSGELYSLTVLLSNVAVREDGTLAARGGPIVGICAEYERPLSSLQPVRVAPFALDEARRRGVPTLRLPEGFLSRPLRLEATREEARPSPAREDKVGRAREFLSALSDAWPRSILAISEVAWPVYRSETAGPPLDAVHGSPLPALDLRLRRTT